MIYPIKEGVIVKTEDKKRVLKEYEVLKKKIEEKEKQKKQDMVMKNWKLVFQSILMNRYFNKKHYN